MCVHSEDFRILPFEVSLQCNIVREIWFATQAWNYRACNLKMGCFLRSPQAIFNKATQRSMCILLECTYPFESFSNSILKTKKPILEHNSFASDCNLCLPPLSHLKWIMFGLAVRGDCWPPLSPKMDRRLGWLSKAIGSCYSAPWKLILVCISFLEIVSRSERRNSTKQFPSSFYIFFLQITQRTRM
jgi:hypothetical protein